MTGAFSPEGSGSEGPEFDGAFGELDDEVVLALNSFDRARNSLHDAIARTAVELPALDAYEEECSEFGSQATAALGEYVGAALAVQDREAVKGDLIGLWRQDDKERTAIFLGIFEGDECFESYRPGVLEEMVDDIFSTDNPNGIVPDAVVDIYGTMLGDELGLFASHLEKLKMAKGQEEAEVQDKREHSISRLAANHALDVAKIAAGTVIALWVHKKIIARGW